MATEQPAKSARKGCNWGRALLYAGVAAAAAAVALPYVDRYWAGGVVAPELLQKDLSGQVIIVTGSNTGIGYETVQQLVKQKAHVVMACRSRSRCEGAKSRIEAAVPGGSVECADLDLGNLASVRSFAAEFKAKHARLDVLVNNAGVMMPPASTTDDGFELQFGTNHLGHFLLTELLLDTLKASAPSRIVDVSSRAHEQGTMNGLQDYNWQSRSYSRIYSYAASKLANVLHAKSLAKRLEGTGVTAVSLHPGVITTELTRHLPFVDSIFGAIEPLVHVFLKTSWEGAATTLHTTLAPAESLVNGAYYSDCAVKVSPNKEAHSDALAAELDALSRKLVGLE